MSKIAILGYGTVGSGIAAVLDTNTAQVAASAGEEVTVGAILDLRDFPGDPHEAQVTHDIETILANPEIEVVCETMGGVEPAYTFSKRAIEAGKSVCTSNKELVATHGPELLELARAHKVSYLFEASVGGGIPVLHAINNSLRHEQIESVTGILNGTTNYILTRMEQEGADFDTVLADAQAKGYAERNPAADIEGHDACRKTAILAGLMSGRYVDPADIPTEGITKVTVEDLREARAAGYCIKLLGSCRQISDEAIEASVAPFLVPLTHPLASVNDVFNAILVHGNMIGDVMFYGRGAGKEATASAVVGDVLDIIRHRGSTLPVQYSRTPAELQASAEGAETKRFASGNSYRVL